MMVLLCKKSFVHFFHVVPYCAEELIRKRIKNVELLSRTKNSFDTKRTTNYTAIVSITRLTQYIETSIVSRAQIVRDKRKIYTTGLKNNIIIILTYIFRVEHDVTMWSRTKKHTFCHQNVKVNDA